MKKRIPPEDELVLIFQEGDVHLGRYRNGEWYDDNENYDDSGLEITHWQHLPDDWIEIERQ